MKFTELFSAEIKDLIAASREIALDLGYDRVTTLHFLLSDCVMNKNDSIRNFCFTGDAEFQRFYDLQKIADATIFGDSLNGNLPLTIEAEQTIRLTLKEFKKYPQEKIQPFHLFLAASNHFSVFSSLLPPEEDLYDRLLKFYKDGGHIAENAKKKTFFERMKFYLK